MSTLTTITGVKWDISSRGGKASFHHPTLGLDITYHPSVGEYVVWSGGLEYYSSHDVTDCLETCSDVILDYFASHFIPSWEEEDIPNTERTVCDQAAE